MDAPATALQTGMLFHSAAHPGSGVDIEQISVRLHEPLDVERFRRSWQSAFDRHPILSARFDWRNTDEPRLRCAGPDRVSFTVEDWTTTATTPAATPSTAGGDRVEAALTAAMRADRLIDFDLENGPLHRFTVARLADDDWWVLWTFHHAILDGRSFPLVLTEVFAEYDGRPRPDADEAVPFSHYAEALLQQDLSAAEVYWKSKLADVESPSQIPDTVGGGTTPPATTGEAPSVAWIERSLTESATDRLRAMARGLGVSLNTCIQAAWYLLLVHYSQQPTIAFGATRACRHAPGAHRDMVGLLINTVPMVVPVDRTESVRDLLGRLAAEQAELRPYETTPLPTIARCAPRAGDSLFDSIVVYDDASLDARMSAAFPEHADRRRFRYDGQTNFGLTLLAYGDPELLLRLEFAVDRFDPETGRRLLDQTINLLAGFAENADRLAVEVPYLTDAELARFADWNATDRPYELDTTLMALFERQVAATPSAVALELAGDALSYRDLNERANRLAHHLRDLGVGPDGTVGVFMERSFEMMVSIYAILKAGGAYVPLDPENPASRTAFMVEDSGISVVLTQAHLEADFVAGDTAAGGVQPIVVDDPASPWADLPATDPEPTAGPEDLAYLLYTSGSTGRPKGVMIEHRSIVNRLLWMQEAYGLTAHDCVLQKTPYTFDVSVWELFWPLEVGARLALAEPGGHKDPAYLVEAINRHGVTTLHFVPSMLQLFVEEPTMRTCRSIDRVICSGEALPRDLQDRLLDGLDVELHNLYGPTEAAVDVTWWHCDPSSPLGTVPIGYPIANTQIHIVDRDLQRLPAGVAGELCIGGVQVARGYHDRAELTADRFVADPYSDVAGATLYRTGDLVRYLPDGAVDFLGRFDHQIKIRGQRLELGEIEAVITDHADVREAVVATTGTSALDLQLVGYLVAAIEDETDRDDRNPDDNALVAAVRSHCERALAPYMVPSAWVVLDAFPLNANGKIDRSALPDPSPRTDDRQVVATSSDTESAVLRIWQELLGQTPIGATETFFDAGGNSLLLIRLAHLLSVEFGADVGVRQLLQHATIRQQATLVGHHSDEDDQALTAAAAAADSRRSRSARRRRRS